MSAITVIKLGGSLCRDPRDSALPAWLAALARRAAADRHRRWVIVPGGGDFADAVRDTQSLWRFDDLSAHNMAVLAMEQTARLMVAVAAATGSADAAPVVLATGIDAVRAAWAAGQLPVWAGRDVLRDTADQLTRWEVTSDSLAAWLAGALDADRLVLVKHGVGLVVAEAPGIAPAFARRLAHDGVADVALPAFVGEAGVALAVWPAEQPELLLATAPAAHAAGLGLPACAV